MRAAVDIEAAKSIGLSREERLIMFQSKKIISKLVICALFVALTITSEAYAQRGSFEGHYSGVGEAAGAALTLAQNGSQVVGRLHADGATYIIEAKVSRSEGYGVVEDPSSGVTQRFRLKLSGGELFVALPQTTGAGQVFRFQRGGRAAQEGRYPNQGGYQAQGGGGQIDPRLVGRWRRTESMGSGGASFVSDKHLVVRPNGTYTLSSGGYAGGDANVSVAGGGGGGASGRWRVRGKIVEISEGGTFQPYARYHIEGNDMLFTFGDGSTQFWQRR
jgi:hypothetical protein